MPLMWPPLWGPCLPKIGRGGPVQYVPVDTWLTRAPGFSPISNGVYFTEIIKKPLLRIINFLITCLITEIGIAHMYTYVCTFWPLFI
jgi:hypothetical protein